MKNLLNVAFDKINHAVAKFNDAMTSKFKPLVDGDNAIFSASAKLNDDEIIVTVHANIETKYFAKTTLSFERFAYYRERYIRTYFPKAIRHAIRELIGRMYTITIQCNGTLWSLSSLDDSQNGLDYVVIIKAISTKEVVADNNASTIESANTDNATDTPVTNDYADAENAVDDASIIDESAEDKDDTYIASMPLTDADTNSVDDGEDTTTDASVDDEEILEDARQILEADM